uniref:DUF2922 family protein n=1 Tax=Fervidobacterium nodosum TaxID=2424 RepID=A0A7C5U7B1_9BACT
MKRLSLLYRGYENGKARVHRITIPEPIENIDVSELTQDMQMLKTLNVVPQNFEPDEARITESNIQVLVNLIE